MTINKRDTETSHGTPVGYVAIAGGGYFFTWQSTMDATVESLTEDSQAEPMRRHNIATVERIVRVAWRKEARCVKSRGGYGAIWTEGRT